MNESFQNIGDLIAEPSATFARLKSEARWGVAFVVFCVFAIALTWAVAPYTAHLMSEQLAQTDLSPEEAAIAERVQSFTQTFFIFLAPIGGIVGFIVISALLTLAARFLVKNDALKFKHIYAAVVHISLIGSVIQLVNTALLLVFRNVEEVTIAIDMKMIPGLHTLAGLLLERSENVKLLTFLSHINPASLWVIAVIAIAISALAEMDRTQSRLAAVIIWLISIVPEVIFTS